MGAQQPWVTLQMDTGMPWSAGILMGMEDVARPRAPPEKVGAISAFRRCSGSAQLRCRPFFPATAFPRCLVPKA